MSEQKKETRHILGDSSFSITKSSGTLNISASDGFGDDASQVVKDKVQNFSDLPQPAINGMVVEVTGDASNNFDNYFVKYNTDLWEETLKPATPTNIKNNKNC